MAESFTDNDERHMRRALSLALRGQGRVEPNPMVGCVIVRGRRVVGEGYHRRFGGPHAEVHALRQAGSKARGATVYVTLEPCCHQGKTPPCTEALIKAGVGRVVVAMRDSFPPVCGRGFRLLRSAGMDVSSGLLGREARRLNAPYIKLQKTGQPWVILKWAQSLDGKIATRTGDSQWISCLRSRQWAHRIRSRVDAIVVGVGTVLADDPSLTCRDAPVRRIATRVVLDPNLRTPTGAKLVRTAREVPTMIVTDNRGGRSRRAAALEHKGVEILCVKRKRNGLDLQALLRALGRRNMTNIMVEGGGRSLGAFYDAGLADEAIVFVAPRLIGGEDAVSPLAGIGPEAMQDLQKPIETKETRCDTDRVYQLRFSGA
jgi:diaminohydroxyphosphoribosylaminopyrimidine deaminase/5-amino-6-(5-phosphoribosylamino)uracil reductase